MFGYITTCFMSVASGLAIYFTLVLIKQRWVRTLHHLITYLLLPPIAFVITNIISNNFAFEKIRFSKYCNAVEKIFSGQ